MVQTTVVQFIILGLGLVTSLMLARLLGPTGRGELAAALLWPQSLVYLGSFGIQDACVYYAARPRMRTGVVLTNAFFLFLIQIALLLPLGYLLMPHLLSQQSSAVITISRPLLITTVLGLASLYATSVLRAKLEMGIFNSLSLILPIGTLAGVIWLLATKRLFLDNIAFLYIILYILLALMSFAALFVKRLWDRFRLDPPLLKQMVTYGAKVQIGSMSQMANIRLDQMLMAALLPATQLGLYVVAVSVANITMVIPTAIRTVLAPSIAQVDQATKDIPNLEAQLRMYWSLNVAVGLAILLLAPFAMTIAFGSAYKAAILPAGILILAMVCLGGKEILSGTAYGLGTPLLVSQAELVSLLITALGLAVLLPLWGIVGAAVASLLAYGAALATLALRLRQMHQISPRKTLFLGVRDVPILVGLIHRIMTSFAQRLGRLPAFHRPAS